MLSDPRQFSTAREHSAITDLAVEASNADALQRPGRMLTLRQAFEAALAQGQENVLDAAFRHVPDANLFRVLSEALALAVDAPSSRDRIVAHAVAVPIVLIAVGKTPYRICGALPDIAAVQALFERTSALGPARNFGFSNALCSLEHMQSLSPLAVFRASRELDPQQLHAALPPADIAVEVGREQVHLRFLVGAGIGAPDAPGYAETAANIGSWGREFAKLIGDQLAAPGLQLLALPRPPRDVLSAAYAGRRAQLEVALDLFVSNTLRRFRAVVGDPVAILSTHADGDLRVTLSSPFAEDMVEGFRWPLHPRDDLAQIERHISTLFEDVRLPDVRQAPMVLPELRSNGATMYPRADEWETLGSGGLSH